MPELKRCGRCLKDKLYMDYHDNEWWIPVHDDRKHFEFLLLETFQAGLSRYTILAKRENFRKAFDNFDPVKISQYTEAKQQELMQNAGIIRNRLKIASAITNAQIFLEIQKKHGSWDTFIWDYTDHQGINSAMQRSWSNSSDPHRQSLSTSPLSDQISKDLKKLGMKFVGSTVIYAHLQATGHINDHEDTCWRK